MDIGKLGSYLNMGINEIIRKNVKADISNRRGNFGLVRKSCVYISNEIVGLS